MKIKTIFFDIDNTLLNHKGAEQKALLSIQSQYFPDVDQKEFEEIWIKETKKNWKLFEEKKLNFEQQRNQRIIDVWNFYGKVIDHTEAAEIFQEYLKKYEENWEIFSGILTLINNLKKQNIKIGIISNGDREQQIQKITKINLIDLIEPDLIITSGGMEFSKPDERIFKLAQEKSKCIPEEILMVGDSLEQDIETPKNLGWQTFHINHIDNEEVGRLENFLKTLS